MMRGPNLCAIVPEERAQGSFQRTDARVEVVRLWLSGSARRQSLSLGRRGATQVWTVMMQGGDAGPRLLSGKALST